MTMSCAMAWGSGKRQSRLRIICIYHSNACRVRFLPPARRISLSLKAIFSSKRHNKVRAQARLSIERHLGIGRHYQLFPGIPFYSERAGKDIVTNAFPRWLIAPQKLRGDGELRRPGVKTNHILQRTLIPTTQVELITEVQMWCQHVEQGS